MDEPRVGERIQVILDDFPTPPVDAICAGNGAARSNYGWINLVSPQVSWRYPPKLFYLACQYSDPDVYIRRFHFRLASLVAAGLFARGVFVFSPISHTHPILLESDELHFGFDTWREYDELFISRCDGIYVLAVWGWQASKGVTYEIEFAKKLGKPVTYVNIEGEEITEKEAKMLDVQPAPGQTC
jgi:hypothetical protein